MLNINKLANLKHNLKKSAKLDVYMTKTKAWATKLVLMTK